MSIRWQSLAACAALVVALTACGGDDKADGNANGGSNSGNTGDSTGGSGSNGNAGSTGNTGDGGASNGTDSDAGEPPLGPGVVGKACATDADCGAGGECRDPLEGGDYGGEDLGEDLPTLGGYCSRDCQADTDCGEGGICFGMGFRGGECRKPCSAKADCGRDNYECAQLNGPLLDEDTGAEVQAPKTCQPLATPVKFTTEVGTACEDEAVCNGGTCLDGNSFPDGYCSGACNADADCGQEGVCVPYIYGSGGLCYEGCSADTDCKRDAMNYGCVNISATIKGCAYKLDPVPDGIIGKECAADTDCANGECEDEFDNIAAPGGYCTAEDCDEDAQCGAGAVCLSNGRGSDCFKGCATDTDCRTGYACADRGTTEKMAKVCFPIATEPAPDAGP